MSTFFYLLNIKHEFLFVPTYIHQNLEQMLWFHEVETHLKKTKPKKNKKTKLISLFIPSLSLRQRINF